ncbi:6-hydroxymethylpterin diphosphokinase MptE-like protein [Clostridium sp. BL-8]|uniref:motility associated factor glycosyltransferase family protein n=1 Tax=Clostridium sp. BL-8 TaxID=349938 RepID=UPI00098C7973|nr:6-hydroxymethylpterin diphosphokinase MptE-like protein [Clostridium sp. BL-8]OOM79976.1 hypothetical protein CLOBL_13440 [Clostridium sp. BL-8]
MNLDIEISRDGYKVLKVNRNDKKIYFGSKYNQKREIEKFLSSIEETTSKDTFIIFGLSFGEHIQELLKAINESNKILIIEFNEELIEYCKNDEVISKIIENERLTITSKKADVKNFILKNINEFNSERLQVKEYCNYGKIYKKEWRDAFIIIRNLVISKKINRNTYKYLGKKFFDNSISNLKYIGESTPVNSLKNVYENKPVIIVSAGPSLIKNINELKGVDNAVILTGGRNLGALLERDITPTCLGVIDPVENTYKLVENFIGKINCPLLFNESSNPDVVKEHQAEKFFYSDCDLIEKAFKQKITNLFAGGSVAHTLTNLAIYMGCNPIIFIGQDLAYTDERKYSIGCVDKDGNPNPDGNEDENNIYVKGIDGKLVRTSLLFNDFRVALENLIEHNKNIKFINATEGGANIEGTENRRLRDVLKELKEEKIIPMKKFFNNVNKTDDIINQLELTLIQIKDYVEICKTAQITLKDYEISYRSNNQREVDKNIEKLNVLDRKIIEKNHEITLLTTVLMEVVVYIEHDDKFIVNYSDSKITAFNKELNRSNALYSEIRRILEICYEEIEEKISEMKGEN